MAAAKLGEPGPPGPPLGFFFLTAESGNPPAGLNMASHVELSRSSDSRSNNFGKLELRFGLTVKANQKIPLKIKANLID